jgi:hypothetical protein
LLMFDEFRSPSYLRYTRNRQVGDLMSHGSLVVDPVSGRILAAELTAEAPPPSYSTTMKVRYQEEPQLKILVPIALEEHYWQPQKPRDDRFEVSSSYVNFRRFQVTTDEISRRRRPTRTSASACPCPRRHRVSSAASPRPAS